MKADERMPVKCILHMAVAHTSVLNRLVVERRKVVKPSFAVHPAEQKRGIIEVVSDSELGS